jgi:hypothetical protein
MSRPAWSRPGTRCAAGEEGRGTAKGAAEGVRDVGLLGGFGDPCWGFRLRPWLPSITSALVPFPCSATNWPRHKAGSGPEPSQLVSHTCITPLEPLASLCPFPLPPLSLPPLPLAHPPPTLPPPPPQGVRGAGA